MKKVLFNIKTVDFKAQKFIDEQLTAITASTKSQNILSDNLKKSGKIVVSEIAVDIWLDKAKTAKALDEYLTACGFTGEIKNGILANMIDGLDRVCCFEKPTARKKD